MRIIVIVTIFLSINMGFAQASEIVGFISTNPNIIFVPDAVSLPNATSNYPKQNTNLASTTHEKSDAATTTNVIKIEINDDEDEEVDISREEDVLVLGMSYYREHSLLRGGDKKIYLIEGVYKKQIRNLLELKKYAGQKIIDVDATSLSVYKNRNHLNGDLLRQTGDKNIYCLVNSRLRRVLGLSELRGKHQGKIIFNLKKEEMRLYKYY